MDADVTYGVRANGNASCWLLNLPDKGDLIELPLTLDADSRLHYVAAEVFNLYPEIDGEIRISSPTRGPATFPRS